MILDSFTNFGTNAKLSMEGHRVLEFEFCDLHDFCLGKREAA